MQVPDLVGRTIYYPGNWHPWGRITSVKLEPDETKEGWDMPPVCHISALFPKSHTPENLWEPLGFNAYYVDPTYSEEVGWVDGFWSWWCVNHRADIDRISMVDYGPGRRARRPPHQIGRPRLDEPVPHEVLQYFQDASILDDQFGDLNTLRNVATHSDFMLKYIMPVKSASVVFIKHDVIRLHEGLKATIAELDIDARAALERCYATYSGFITEWRQKNLTS